MNKFYIASNTFYLRELINVKNIRFAYISIDPKRQRSTNNLDFDVELAPDFYNHIRYYRVEFDDDWPVAIYEVGGNKLVEFNKNSNKNEFLQYKNTMEYNKEFLKSNLYDSIGDAGIALQQWIRMTAEDKAKTYIVDFLEYNED